MNGSRLRGKTNVVNGHSHTVDEKDGKITVSVAEGHTHEFKGSKMLPAGNPKHVHLIADAEFVEDNENGND